MTSVDLSQSFKAYDVRGIVGETITEAVEGSGAEATLAGAEARFGIARCRIPASAHEPAQCTQFCCEVAVHHYDERGEGEVNRARVSGSTDCEITGSYVSIGSRKWLRNCVRHSTARCT